MALTEVDSQSHSLGAGLYWHSSSPVAGELHRQTEGTRGFLPELPLLAPIQAIPWAPYVACSARSGAQALQTACSQCWPWGLCAQQAMAPACVARDTGLNYLCMLHGASTGCMFHVVPCQLALSAGCGSDGALSMHIPHWLAVQSQHALHAPGPAYKATVCTESFFSSTVY